MAQATIRLPTLAGELLKKHVCFLNKPFLLTLTHLLRETAALIPQKCRSIMGKPFRHLMPTTVRCVTRTMPHPRQRPAHKPAKSYQRLIHASHRHTHRNLSPYEGQTATPNRRANIPKTFPATVYPNQGTVHPGRDYTRNFAPLSYTQSFEHQHQRNLPCRSRDPHPPRQTPKRVSACGTQQTLIGQHRPQGTLKT